MKYTYKWQAKNIFIYMYRKSV